LLIRAWLDRPGLIATSTSACRSSRTSAARTIACSAPARTSGASLATRCEESLARSIAASTVQRPSPESSA
jgi:hypothetical protein